MAVKNGVTVGKILESVLVRQKTLKNIACINGVNWEHRCTGVHIYEDAKIFCPNLILFFPNNVKQEVLM